MAGKYELLAMAWSNFSSTRRSTLRVDYDEFCVDQGHWLDDYVLFRALKARHGGAYYLRWPEEFVRREPAALARARRDLAELIEQVRFAQFLLFRQGRRPREYAARMNLPGSVEGNWCLRCTGEILPAPLLDRLRDLTTSSKRCS
jgi:4-alpha-glucanotransferase